MQLLAAAPQAPIDGEPYQEWLNEDGTSFTTFHRTPDGFIVRFLDRVDFNIAIDSGAVTCVPTGTFSEVSARFLYTNQIMPLMLSHSGELVLHGSGIAAEGYALGFVGQSGRGKSTMAAAFAQAGYPFLTEDGLLLRPDGDRYIASPSHPKLRLWADSDEALFASAQGGEDEFEKRALDASAGMAFHDQPLPLRVLYLLGPGESSATTMTRLKPAEAFAELIRHAFILDFEDRKRMRQHFDHLGQFTETIPCFALDYPRRYEALPAVLESILDHARSGV